MTFTQHVETCTDPAHGPCTVIWCDTDEDLLDPDTGALAHPAGTVLWHSHMHSGVHPEHRINPGHPALDHRGDTCAPLTHSEPCDACRPHFPAGDR